SKRSLVEKVDFVTGTAKYSSNKVIVVTNLGVLKYDREKKTWFITAIYENTSVEDILNNTAFEVVVSPTLRIITLRNDEREFIKRMDPYNLRSALA
ncbi:MAG: CoA-transferase subunit beta, partial [Sulfolobaceae archaeon]